MIVGSKKKKMTIGWRHRFGSIGSVTDFSNTVVGDIDSAADVRATITTIGPSVMVVQWSKTPIRWAVTNYFGSLGIGGVRQSHYFNNPPTGGSLFDGMVGGETNSTAFSGATILVVRPSDLHHKRLHWPSHRC